MWLFTPAGWPLTSPSPLKALSTPSKLSKPCKNRVLTLKSWTASTRERGWHSQDQTISVNYLGFGQNDDFLINSKVIKSNRLIFRILNISVDFFSIAGNEMSEVIIAHCRTWLSWICWQKIQIPAIEFWNQPHVKKMLQIHKGFLAWNCHKIEIKMT